MYNEEIKQRVKGLRKLGWSLGEIHLKTGIPKNTISGWVKDILLTKRQKRRIKKKIIISAEIGRPLAAKLIRKRAKREKEQIKEYAKSLVNLPFDNPTIGKFVCGLLYLCEGAKYPSTRGVIFSNSDPQIILCFLSLLRKLFNIREEKLRCRIMHRWDQDTEKLNKYWSNITNIPLNNFFNTTPDKRTKGKPTLKTNYKGVCSIQYSDVRLQFQLLAIGEEIIKSGAEGDRTLEPLACHASALPIELRPQL